VLPQPLPSPGSIRGFIAQGCGHSSPRVEPKAGQPAHDRFLPRANGTITA
jgi:hypothetical protein